MRPTVTILAACALLASACGEGDCYAPDQNLDSAYESGASGCRCGASEAPVCVPDSRGRNVALICEGERWHAVEDGPCMPSP